MKSGKLFSVVTFILFFWTGFLYAKDKLNTITFDNQSGEVALVKLIGPSSHKVDVAQGHRKTVNVVAGEYYILVRYGNNPDKYRFSKGETFNIQQSQTKYYSISITLHKVKDGNYQTKDSSKSEFDKAIASDASSELNKSTIYKLQKKLKEMGYNPGPLDGILGNKTKMAIKNFQKNAGLEVTGKPDEDTKKLLFRLKRKKLDLLSFLPKDHKNVPIEGHNIIEQNTNKDNKTGIFKFTPSELSKDKETSILVKKKKSTPAQVKSPHKANKNKKDRIINLTPSDLAKHIETSDSSPKRIHLKEALFETEFKVFDVKKRSEGFCVESNWLKSNNHHGAYLFFYFTKPRGIEKLWSLNRGDIITIRGRFQYLMKRNKGWHGNVTYPNDISFRQSSIINIKPNKEGTSKNHASRIIKLSPTELAKHIETSTSLQESQLKQVLFETTFKILGTQNARKGFNIQSYSHKSTNKHGAILIFYLNDPMEIKAGSLLNRGDIITIRGKYKTVGLANEGFIGVTHETVIDFIESSIIKVQ